MTQEPPPESLRAERLVEHMRVLCKEIGPRPATSSQERQAAGYVKRTLEKLSLKDVQVQSFKSQNSAGWIAIPTLVAGAAAMPIAWLLGQWGKAASGLLLLLGTYVMQDLMKTRPPFFQKLIARGTSQNVIVRVPPTGPAKRTIHLVGHLDTNKQRFLMPPPKPGLMKPLLTFSLFLGLAGGISLLADVLLGRLGISWWQWLIGAALLPTLLSFSFDETQPHIEGANDNATAVAILLGIAEALRAHPLQHTEVILLFTGCEEVGCVGIENYLQQFAPSRDNTYWIDLEMVGTGNLCYVTKHGVSYLTEYAPAEEMIHLAAQTAREHPELGVSGKDMLIVEEVGNLRHRGYNALCIAGYDEAGFLPNWHRASDNLENIEPDTLSRAARYTWALALEIDALPA